MNIEKMVDDLIKAQEAIDEPITITRKTDQEDEIHNACSGSGTDLIVLQVAAISELFESLASNIPDSETRSLKRAILSTIEKSLNAAIDNKPTIH